MFLGSAMKSVGSAVNTGMNLGTGRGFGGGQYGGLGSSLTLGGIGASIGAVGSSLLSDGTINPAMGAMAGGAVGALGLPAMGAVAGGVGAVGIGAAKLAPSVAGGIGSTLIKASPVVAGIGATMGTRATSKLWNTGSSMVKWDEDATSLDKVKFTGFGKALIAGTYMAEGVRDSWNKIEQSRMGANYGVVDMAPKTPSYANNSGATGDLVFALNANKRG